MGRGPLSRIIMEEIRQGRMPGLEVVCLISDDALPATNLPVYHSKELSLAIQKHSIRKIYITDPVAGQSKRRLQRELARQGVACKILPDLKELLESSLSAPPLEDLLKRPQVILRDEAVEALVRDRTVLITGAGGSIGAEIVRQLASLDASALVLVDAAETALVEIDRELRESTRAPERLASVVGDIRDRAFLSRLFQDFDIQIVFHCAAYKHVPMMELNPGQAVQNNVIGTVQLANAARDAGVERFVMISTDKAVNPVNVMGATKRIAELYIQNLARTCDTRFITVRFGNVLGSQGSVIPLFNRQIDAGGPVTVTHPDIIRYFMTIPEAASLVLQAGAMGKEGEIFILDMGEPLRIKDLAEDLIRLRGLEPHRDIEIRYIGLRPGEKLFEELFQHDEAEQPTHHPRIRVASSRFLSLGTLIAQIQELESAARSYQRQAIDEIMSRILPEYRPARSEPPSQARLESWYNLEAV